jgi:tryptophan-rich sensory protein
MILLIFVPLILGFLVGMSSKPDEWYFKLNKPRFNPPSYAFSIAWSILYFLIGISYYLALKDKSFVYWIIPTLHLLLNYLYTPTIFIYRKLLESAFIVSLTLITAIIVAILFYSYGNYLSAYLLIPYILWLMFANYLAWSVYYLN